MQIPKTDLAAIIFDKDIEIIEKYKDILEKDGIKKVKCKNCGKYFFFNPKQPAEYCTNKPYGINMTCQQIAAQRKYKESISPIQKAYTNALKRENKKFHQSNNCEYYELWKKEKTKLREKFEEKYGNAQTDDERITILEEFKKSLKS